VRIALSAALAGALLVAGCGSSGGGTAGDGNGGGAIDEQEEVLAYENGYQQCTGFSLKDLQQTYNSEEATKDSIGDAVARSNPGSPELRGPTKQGCIDAIDKKPFEPSGDLTVATGEG
jgi:hypothetical protein